MAKHHFHLQANWPGGRNEVGTIEAGQLKTSISIPPEMDGPGAGTNPDEMLLGAAATCYIITLAAMLERSGIHQEALTMESEAIVDVTNGVFTYEKIIHKPHVIVTPKFAAQEEKINRLIKKAETSCMISRAIQGNVEIELEPQLTVKA
ncbi:MULTISPECIES: OsmC family protein [Priestia]|uniref:OsmC family protein n=1 Tax=Priestia aryabhattai TaxID=412384 RepID=A0ABD5KSB0_PRIAR|nr:MULTISPECIES: OsmC family protein [Priestia]MBK0293582.1 OsmC family protein [Bacillus sp. S34]NHH93165.1 Peroxiredoxin OsmC [Bacillus sp. MB95]UPK52205.1 OsmC family protein [Bacillus sp. H8-1]AWD67730.1 OsmC family peroxiredoxin [Priestia megaterium]MBY0210582.1 OsmC family protein [Priestia aryabhattai]